jgi:hypothetical protein
VIPVRRSLVLPFLISLAVLCAGIALALAIGQEPPTGSVMGRVTAQESGQPLPASVWLSSKNGGYEHWVQADKNGYYKLPNVPVGVHKLQAASHGHTMEPTEITVTEGKPQVLNLELPANAPEIEIYIHQHMFAPDEQPRLTCHGYVNATELGVKVYKVDLNTFLLKSGGSVSDLLGVDSYSSSALVKAKLDSNTALKSVNTLNFPITKLDVEGRFMQRIDLPKMEPGLYLITADAGGIRQVGWIMVTSLAMVTKTSGSQTVAYTVDLKTGVPVAGAQIAVYVGKKVVASGSSDSQGLATLKLPSGMKGETNEVVIAHVGQSFAFTSAYFPTDQQSDMLIYAYTERPVYKPGQVVFFKGLVRHMTDTGYATPPSLPVTVEVRDSRDTLIYRSKMRTDKFGAYFGSFQLNSEASSGPYTLVSSIEGKGRGQSTDFQVAAYRKPEFQVKVTSNGKRFVRGSTVHATVSANYYFGAPVANAKVHYVVTRTPYWFFEDDASDDTGDATGYSDYGGYGEVVTDGDVQTDANGMAQIDFKADWTETRDYWMMETDQQFNVQADVTDPSGRDVTGSMNMLITRAQFALSVEPDRYVVAQGESVSLSIRAADYDHNPIKHQQLSVVVGHMQWAMESNGNPVTDKVQTVTTDDDGKATLTITPTSPDTQVVVKGRDQLGNEVSASTYIYAGMSNWNDQQAEHMADIKIVTDKKTYAPGDTAKVLINTKSTGMTALVTVEGTRVYDRKVVQLAKHSTMVEIPIKDIYKPNFYIGVCFVKNKQLFSQQARAKVSLASQTLTLKVDPNKPKYLPGENAVYTIKATDPNGKPVKAQLSIGVVDEAIYAIQPETTTPILDYFFARRPNQVNTTFSFPQIYLSDPDKAGPNLLKTPEGNNRIRKRFLDTAFWNPIVETDANGLATVSFQMPDNLTTWRATVRGITIGTLCGESKTTVKAQQDFLVRIEAPRFLVQSDKSSMTTVVQNYTGKDQNVTVTLQCPGLTIDGRTTRQVNVRNNGIERIDWTVRAPKPGSFDILARAKCSTTGDAMQISLPVYPHGMETTTPQVGLVTGNADERLAIDVRQDSVAEAGKLRIHLAPSLASSLLGTLDYLAQYPWGCTEQTTSSFLPDVILYRSFRGLGMQDKQIESQLPDMVNKGLFRLYRFQLDDGGWSWCEYGQSDPWMTAYVCYGLLQARNAGFAVNKSILDNGIERLGHFAAGESVGDESAASHNPDVEERAYILYVLSMAGKDVAGDLTTLAQKPKLSNESLGWIALAFNQLGRRDEAKAVLSRLESRAISEPNMTHWTWGNASDDYVWGDIEPTAVALQAMLAIEPSNPRVLSAVRWLMANRQGDAWYSTRDSAMVLYAMANYLKMSKELSPDFDAVVSINGREIGRKHFGKDSLFNPEYEIDVDGKSLPKGRNSLEIVKTGAGSLYYNTQLTQYVVKDLTTPTSNGTRIRITREYFRPSPGYQGEGVQLLGPAITECRVGDTVLVRLTVDSHTPISHALLEDFIPAGFEIITQGDTVYDDWNYWWVGQDVKDQKIAFYLDELNGHQVVEYRMRAGFSGDFHALPAQIFAMYDPNTRASTIETPFGIR